MTKDNQVFDVSFFDINNQNSTLTFKDENVTFKVVQPYNIEDDIGYKDELSSTELLQFRQVEVLNKSKTKQFFNVFKSEKLNNKQYGYIKRVRNNEGKVYIVVCEYDKYKENDIVETLASKKLVKDVDYKFIEDIALIPKYPPLNKSVSDIWSGKYWPMNWKGNLKENKLKQVFLNEYQLPKYSKFKQLFEELNRYKVENHLTKNDHVTLFYNSNNDEFKIFADTQKITKFVLSHSIINGIDDICSNKNSEDYLLQNYFVVTTHEPCQMCCMALLHSRIKLLLFNEFSKKSIKMLSGDDFSLASYKPLNWEFQVLQYDFSKNI